LATYRQRFSHQNLFTLFVACAFPVHVWAIIGLLNQIPAWILRVNLWELAGMIGSWLVFTLLESLIVTLGVIVLMALIPGKWFTEKVVVFCVLFIWLTSIVSVIAHFQEPLMRSFWGILIVVAYLAMLPGSYWLLQRFPKFEMGLKSFLERLAILTGLYLFLDVVGLAIVIIRNL
jgi:hypothetical protein